MSSLNKNKILVANIGSTSFKFVVFSMPDETFLCKGGVERIGSGDGIYTYQKTGGAKREKTCPIPDYPTAIRMAFESLLDAQEGVIGSMDEVRAIGFKPVMAKGVSGTVELTEDVLKAMEEIYTLLPAHNPPYVNAVRLFRQEYPAIPCIGTFETAFYDQVPEANTRFAIPKEWHGKYGIRRNGFHGASHRFVTERAAEILGGARNLRMISCHLGGSSSIAAVRDGVAVDSSWGMTPQSGLPQNNRVGDFDSFALIYLIRDLGLGVENVERMLMKESGLKGLAGTATGDLRDIKAAADAGSADAQIALKVLIKNIRDYIGKFLVELGGCDVLIFTAGIAENNPWLREAICAGLDGLGIELDPTVNQTAPKAEVTLSKPTSKTRIMLIPTSEETIIARNAWRLLEKKN
ncbi:acetate/propionate family kinase [Kamptonema cortianum]|nr:acetate/propionate family kinase [Oscillatoria laete-virens]MDK3156427.1 acetate/propionate family kinase [Kamptonema cortianum]MDL5046286.1 acetate/propionate family kinase [Oscillatoria amoena NRMC-F 0135]MDL5053892.1 acetate/propionate family kinase [Oscillatoria laete-virens NRMC-F 0139]